MFCKLVVVWLITLFSFLLAMTWLLIDMKTSFFIAFGNVAKN
jgi:hypothetical protein